MRLSDFDDWARQHHGLLTRSASGLTGDAWRRAIRAGTLIPLHPHVARLPGSATTQLQRIAAGVLGAGPGALASHHSAAVLWKLVDTESAFVHVTHVDRDRRPRLTGVIVHRPTDREHLQQQRPQNVASTNVLRTLCDLGADEPHLVTTAVGQALAARLIDFDTLVAAATSHGRRGRRGIPALRAAIDTWTM